MIPDISNLIVHRVVTPEEKELAYDIRWAGYRKYFSAREEVIDHYDSLESSILLLAKNETGVPVGTIRFIDRRFHPIELDSFLDLEKIIPAHLLPCIEPTRFSVPKHSNSYGIKLALWKTLLLYCQANAIPSMILCIRPGASRDYKKLECQSLEESGRFNHPLLGKFEHQTYVCNIALAKEKFLKNNDNYYEFFYGKENYPNLSFNPL